MLRNPTGLSYAVVALLAGNIAFDVLLAVFELRFLLTDATTDFFDPAVFGTLDLNVTYSFAFVEYVATGIVFIVWFHRLRKNAEVWAGDLQSRKPGWAIGGWLIPRQPVDPAGDRRRHLAGQPLAAVRRRPRPGADAPQRLVDALGRRHGRGEDRQPALQAGRDRRGLHHRGFLFLAGYLLDIAAAVLAILFVRRLTSMQHAKATGMIPATQ